MKILRKFTEKIIRRHHSPEPEDRRTDSNLLNISTKQMEKEEESNEDREEWEKSQRSSGLIEKHDELSMDIQRQLYRLMKDKFIGKVHQEFTKKAHKLNDGTKKTYADNVGLYSQKIRYMIQPRPEDQAARASFDPRLASKVNKTRIE